MSNSDSCNNLETITSSFNGSNTNLAVVPIVKVPNIDLSMYDINPNDINDTPADAPPSTNNDDSDDDLRSISRIFETKALAIEKWLRERAPPDVVTRIHTITDDVKSNFNPKRASVTSDLFHQWIASSPLKVIYLNEIMLIRMHNTQEC